jgi:hypothetical protein
MEKISLMAGACFALLVAACSPTDPESSDENSSGNIVMVGTDVQQAAWVAKSTIDPMTDHAGITAERTFQSGPFTIDVSILCNAEGRPRYEFATFLDGEAAPLRWEQRRGNPFFNRTLQYGLRVDGNPSVEAYAVDDRYSNVFSYNAAFLESDAKNVVSAARLVVQFPLQQGDATVEIDQQDPAVQQALATCAEDAPAPVPSPSPSQSPFPSAAEEKPTTPIFRAEGETEEADGGNTAPFEDP